MEIVVRNPEILPEFVEAVVTALPAGGTYLDTALSYLALEAFPRAATQALSEFAQNPKNEAAEAVVSHASLQCVSSLHPHLESIFEMGINKDRYYRCWPWRGSGLRSIDFLKGVLGDERRNEDERLLAMLALLETRNDEGIRTALLNQKASRYLCGIGRELKDGLVQPLHADATFHLYFNAGYLDDSLPLWMTLHPTWHLETPDSGLMPFGGGTAPIKTCCAVCGGDLRRLITLVPVPDGVGVTGLRELCLATCLSCLGWEQEKLFYSHDAAGTPTQIGYNGGNVIPEFPVGPLKATQGRLVPTPARWRWQNWGLSNSRENLHRVGGAPCWIQGPQYSACPQCKRTMHFLMQLDSNLPLADGDEWLWGSGGIGYVFWCDDCKVSGLLRQCT